MNRWLVILIFCHSVAWGKDLSNELPVGFVKELFANQLWSASFEDGNSAAAQDLRTFWTQVKTDTVTPAAIADKILNPIEGNNGFAEYPLNYLQKISLVRYLDQNATAGVSSKRVDAILGALTQKYFSLSLTLIRWAKIDEYEPILDRAKQLVQTGALRLEDLSPARRKELAGGYKNTLHAYLGREILSTRDGRYDINGLYLENAKRIALDLSRPVAEIAVTLAHEIVHAADPEIQAYRDQVARLTPLVLEKIRQRLPKAESDAMAKALVQDVYKELGRPDMLELFDDVRAQRIQTLEKNLSGDLAQDPQIAEWTRAIIGATIANEYKAYALSLAFYARVKTAYRVFPALTERDLIMRKLFRHDVNFAKSLSLAMNPFNQESYLSVVMKDTAVTQETLSEVNALKMALEYQYLTQSKTYIESIPEKYKKVLSTIAQDSDEPQKSYLPEWTQPGRFESPTNPYIILTAKVSTAWVIRFKQGVQKLVNDLAGIHESLLTTRAGVLDFHDVPLGELKLLGLQPMDAHPENLPYYVAAFVRDDFDSVPAIFKEYFGDTAWKPQGSLVRESIPQAVVSSNLIRLRLIKAVYWLRNAFPPSLQNIAAIKVFQHKIYEGFYDQDEIQPERAQELNKELEDALKQAQVTAPEVDNIRYLMNALATFYLMAADQKWGPLTAEFEEKIQQARLLLSNLGIESDAVAGMTKAVDDSIAAFQKQVLVHFAKCAQTEALDFDYDPSPDKRTLFQLGRFEFPLTGLCHERNLYILRQPGDYKRSAPTYFARTPTGEMRPNTVIFQEGRPIILEPYYQFSKAQTPATKGSWWSN